MAASGSTSRAIYAGLSCGFVFAVPVAAYVATMPFADANSTVTACALPFTVGALAGVGILSAVTAAGSRRDSEAADGAQDYSSASSTRDIDDVERFFGSRRVPKDVPVIARAQDAMSEEDAWADIDAMLTEDSPISCDAANSKDIYQIALEELQRETRAATQQAAAPSASVDAASPDAQAACEAVGRQAAAAYAVVADQGAAYAPGSTAMFVAMAQAAAQAAPAAPTAPAASVAPSAPSSAQAPVAAPAPAAPQPPQPPQQPVSAAPQPAAPAPSQPAPQSEADATVVMRPQTAPAASTAHIAVDADYDTDAAQRAALASLDELDGERLEPAAPASRPVAAPRPASAPHAEPARAAASGRQVPGGTGRQAGREDIWASALDILAEDAPAPHADEEPAYVGRHMRAADPARAAAVAEGRRANAVHQHVNELIEEELGQVPSSSVRRSSREYLRVIQGGTASMPSLKAEA